MGSWNQILDEISRSNTNEVRRKYLKKLSEKTNRNVVCYYSGWLQKTGARFSNVINITDDDKTGFMSCFHGLDTSRGLDLLLHSPGGGVSATESLIYYIRAMFGDDIRVFVPQLSMSGGTLLALMGKEIWMGKHSNLGPIDPQFGSVPAVTLIEEFRRAHEEIVEEPTKLKVWEPILSRISPAFLTMAQQAIELSHAVAVNAMTQGMFRGQETGEQKAKEIAEELANVRAHKEHARHIHSDDLKNMGLNIKDLESDDELQDVVLSVHHAFTISLTNSAAAKIIENHEGTAFIKSVQRLS